MDGYEVAGRLRELPGLADVILVAMTGYGQAEDRERSRQAGFNEHLVKPVDPEALRALLAGERASI
jgi:CheY-like chemotaxis protein